MKHIWLCFLFTVITDKASYAECIPVNNLTFEKIDTNKLLAIQNGKNIAIINLYGSLPTSMSRFRFFSEKLCSVGAESTFHIDEKLFSVNFIQKFQ